MQLALKEIYLKTSWIKSGNKSFIYEEVIDSTLNIALNEHNQNNYIGQIVISDKQLEGKGTYNKSWYSEPYKDLTFSIILGSKNNFQQDLIDGEICSADKDAFYLLVHASGLSLNDVIFDPKKLIKNIDYDLTLKIENASERAK